jgi:hypothetical protein
MISPEQFTGGTVENSGGSWYHITRFGFLFNISRLYYNIGRMEQVKPETQSSLILGIKTSRLVKSVVFVVLLIAASCFLGIICRQVGQLGDTIFSPSLDMLYLLLRLLLALALVAITAGLVATLVRPLWICFVAFALSSLAALFIWGLNLVGIVIAAVFLLAGILYSRGVAKGLSERITFTVRPIQDSQTILFIALIIAACGCFYSGYADQIEEEGFTIPPFVTDMAGRIAEGQIEEEQSLTPEEKEQRVAEVKEEVEQQIERWIEPYEEFIPIGIAISLLGILMTIVQLLSWLPILILRAVFAILAACHVTSLVTETQEVERLTID